ncbi:MAG: hypothetical protein KDC43_13730 [Saprospiraceae bacterium]|nr:hypothetical protein [Saprospiraceae bacterium]MCB0676794.1 hypothetical protein [Saprospiraceae bacterium]
MRSFFLLVIALLVGQFSFAQDAAPAADHSGFVQLNTGLSYRMLEPNQDLRKVNILAHALADGELGTRSLYIGASLIAIADFQSANVDSKFGWLMRHPTASNQIGDQVSEAVLHSAQLSLTAPITSWLAAYMEVLYDPEQSFGAGTITALGRNQLQLRKGYILLGDLNKFPIYLALGKMDAPFGQTNSVSPFTSSTMWHAFGGLGYGAMATFDKAGFKVSVMAVQGGAQFRALNAPVEGTDVPSRLNNFVADANYTAQIAGKAALKVGVSYVKGSGYCQDWPVTHFSPCEDTNPATAFYGDLTVVDRVELKGSFATTMEVWPGTHNPNAPLDEFDASKVTSLDIGGKFTINPNGKIIYALSGEFSNFIAGAAGSPWERQNQIVVGLSGLVNHSSRLFLEFFRAGGYVPLNFLSGGNFEDPGMTHSDHDSNTIGLVVGGILTL